MEEKTLERKLRGKAKAAGCLALKFSSPYYTGMPDRMILIPGGRVIFAEIKTTGRKPTRRQELVHGQLRELGFPVRVVDSGESLKEVLDEMEGGVC